MRLLSLLFLLLLLLVAPALGEATYRVEGLPLDYALGTAYEVSLTVSEPGAVTGVAITTTNGSLSAVNEFGEGEAHELQFGPATDGWSFWWLAPADPHELGEGEAGIRDLETALDHRIAGDGADVHRRIEILDRLEILHRREQVGRRFFEHESLIFSLRSIEKGIRR